MATKKLGQNEVTLSSVARASGVSTAAASMALRGKAGVSEATRTRVADTARMLGYEPAVSKARPRRKTLTVGVVVRALEGGPLEANPFYGPILAGIEESCRNDGKRVLFATMPADERGNVTEVPRIVTDKTCDGLIIVGVNFAQAATDMLRGAPPAVLVDGYAAGDVLDSVVIDNVGGARTAVQYLISRGHRDIALLGTDTHSHPSIMERRGAYERALAEAGLSPHYIDVAYRPSEEVASAAIAYLHAHPEVSAVFGANDFVAVILLQAAAEAGISIPGQISVIGFDNVDHAAFVSPALTTIAVDKVGLGQMAVSLLMHRLKFPHSSVTRTVVRTALVERRSVGSGPGSGS